MLHGNKQTKNDVKYIWNNSHIWTAVVDQSEEWSSSFQIAYLEIGKFTAMIILHFDLQPQFKYINYFMYTSHHFTPHGRYELSKLTTLPMCGFIAQLVE